MTTNTTNPIKLRLPFAHTVLAYTAVADYRFALVEKAGEYVTYRVDETGACFWGHYMPMDSTSLEKAHHKFQARVLETLPTAMGLEVSANV